jgi:hypothetical protein
MFNPPFMISPSFLFSIRQPTRTYRPSIVARVPPSASLVNSQSLSTPSYASNRESRLQSIAYGAAWLLRVSEELRMSKKGKLNRRRAFFVVASNLSTRKRITTNRAKQM